MSSPIEPDHYIRGGISCAEAVEAMCGYEGTIGYWEGTILAYLWRWREKNGVEDLRKAKRCVEFLIELAERVDSDARAEEHQQQRCTTTTGPVS